MGHQITEAQAQRNLRRWKKGHSVKKNIDLLQLIKEKKQMYGGKATSIAARINVASLLRG